MGRTACRGSPDRSRTGVTALRGRRPGPLDDGTMFGDRRKTNAQPGTQQTRTGPEGRAGEVLGVFRGARGGLGGGLGTGLGSGWGLIFASRFLDFSPPPRLRPGPIPAATRPLKIILFRARAVRVYQP